MATCLNKAVLSRRIIDSSFQASETIKGHTGAVLSSQQTGSESWNFLSGSVSVCFFCIIFMLLYSLSQTLIFPFICVLFLCQNSVATCGWKVLKLWKQTQDLAWFTRFPPSNQFPFDSEYNHLLSAPYSHSHASSTDLHTSILSGPPISTITFILFQKSDLKNKPFWS